MEFKKEWSFPSHEMQYIKDITEDINDAIAKTVKDGGTEGLVFAKVRHTTAGLNVLEYDEPNLLRDFTEFSQDLVPEDPLGKWVTHRGYRGPVRMYRHHCKDNTRRPPHVKDDDENAGRHFRTTLFSLPSIQWDYVGGRLDLGPYQRFVFMEFDGRDGSDGNPPRTRTIQLRIRPSMEVLILD